MEPAPASAHPAPRERVLTLPLVLFLLAVAAVLAIGIVPRLQRPAPADAIRLLADGDLDGDERRAVLDVLAVDGRGSADLGERWAAALAAVALGDRAALTAALQTLGGGEVPSPAPPVDAREWLGLGDPLLQNVLGAWLAEAAGDAAGAAVHWRRAAALCRYVPHALAAELAAAGSQRTAAK
ncbi:MAG: hypothetical protein JNL08_01650 [Planctomycetes bacterium]|nr:hypothetical protein [Planctomycetota bacterium]